MYKRMFLAIAFIIIAIPVFAQSKTTTSRRIFYFEYTEFNDGCLVQGGTYSHYDRRSGQHRNENALVRAEINRFNSEIRRLNAVPDNAQQDIFNRTEIGSSYFVYRIDQINDRRLVPGRNI